MESVKVYELYDFWYRPWWSHTVLWIVGGVFLCLLLVCIIWTVYKRRKAKAVSSWDRALQDLEHLKPEECKSYEQRKQLYSQITNILKIYLGERYTLDLHDKTDYESLKCLKRYIGSSILLEKLEAIMSGAVVAKFAPSDVIQQKMKEHIAESIVIVKNTKPS